MEPIAGDLNHQRIRHFPSCASDYALIIEEIPKVIAIQPGRWGTIFMIILIEDSFWERDHRSAQTSDSQDQLFSVSWGSYAPRSAAAASASCQPRTPTPTGAEAIWGWDA